MKEQKLQHEDFSIEQGRFKIVRENRLEPQMPCYLTIQNNRYKVLDYCSFGVSIESEHSFQEEYFENCQFSYGEIDIAGVTLKIAHAVAAGDNKIKYGLEVVANEIDVETINAYQVSCDTAKQIQQELTGDVEIPAEFQLKTLALKSKLEKVSKIVNSAGENLLANTSKEKNNKLETAFGIFFSHFLRDTFLGLLNNLEKDLDGCTSQVQRKAHKFFRAELGDYIFSSAFVDRVYRKPHGYAGDFEMMNQIYNNELIGGDLFAKCFNKAILEAPASKAVRNRSEYLFRKIHDALANASPEKRVKIISIAAGPAKELQLLMEKAPHLLARTTIHLLDQDLRSLKLSKVVMSRMARQADIELDVEYFNLAIKNVLEEGLPADDYDLIYSAGLFDYFSDPVAVLTANTLYNHLQPGGKLIIGNFNINNPSRFLMECVGDWHLIHRSPEDLSRMFENITRKIEIECENENVNLFAVLEK